MAVTSEFYTFDSMEAYVKKIDLDLEFFLDCNLLVIIALLKNGWMRGCLVYVSFLLRFTEI